MTKNNNVINEFLSLSKIYRPSGTTKEIAKYLKNKLLNYSNDVCIDKYDNVYANIKGSKGFEKLPPIILQAHSDMVMIAKDINIIKKHGVNVQIKGDKIFARNSTLGADNGIGIALILSLLSDKNLNHRPLQVIFTSNEESGMVGAKHLDAKKIKGEFLINLDSEKDDEVIIASSGGSVIEGVITLKPLEVNNNHNIVKLTISGLLGGHSAVNISDNRINAIISLMTIYSECNKLFKAKLISINGGTVVNAIPTTCELIMTIDDVNKFKSFLDIRKQYLLKRYPNEKSLKLSFVKLQNQDFKVIDNGQSIINNLLKIPNGLFKTDKATNLPLLSSNLGVIKTIDSTLTIGINTRALKSNDAKSITTKINSILKQTKAKIDFHYSSSWNEELKLNSFQNDFYYHLIKYIPNAKKVYALGGIENKYFDKKIKSLSYGVNVYNPHSVNEWASISSINRVYKILFDFLSLNSNTLIKIK